MQPGTNSDTQVNRDWSQLCCLPPDGMGVSIRVKEDHSRELSLLLCLRVMVWFKDPHRCPLSYGAHKRKCRFLPGDLFSDPWTKILHKSWSIAKLGPCARGSVPTPALPYLRGLMHYLRTLPVQIRWSQWLCSAISTPPRLRHKSPGSRTGWLLTAEFLSHNCL
jgi:hypothetical protein